MDSHRAQDLKPRVEEIKATIRTHRSNGHFAEGALFIASLPKEVKVMRSVAIEAAQLYLVQGHHRLAAQTCDDVSGSVFSHLESSDLPPTLWNEEVAAFELVRANIWIGRYSKLRTALKIARRLGSVWRLEGSKSNNSWGYAGLPMLIRPAKTKILHWQERLVRVERLKMDSPCSRASSELWQLRMQRRMLTP